MALATGYQAPRYQPQRGVTWYHVMYGHVPGHQLDFIYRPHIPHEKLRPQHFSDLQIIIRHLQPPTWAPLGFAFCNLSAHDTQHRAGHGALAFVVSARVHEASDHAGRGAPVFAHSITLVDQPIDGTFLGTAARAFVKSFRRAGPEWFRGYYHGDDPLSGVRQAEYVTRFADLPHQPRPHQGATQRWRPRPGGLGYNRLYLFHESESGLDEQLDAAARLTALFYRSKTTWLAITNCEDVAVDGLFHGTDSNELMIYVLPRRDGQALGASSRALALESLPESEHALADAVELTPLASLLDASTPGPGRLLDKPPQEPSFAPPREPGSLLVPGPADNPRALAAEHYVPSVVERATLPISPVPSEGEVERPADTSVQTAAVDSKATPRFGLPAREAPVPDSGVARARPEHATAEWVHSTEVARELAPTEALTEEAKLSARGQRRSALVFVTSMLVGGAAVAFLLLTRPARRDGEHLPAVAAVTQERTPAEAVPHHDNGARGAGSRGAQAPSSKGQKVSHGAAGRDPVRPDTKKAPSTEPMPRVEQTKGALDSKPSAKEVPVRADSKKAAPPPKETVKPSAKESPPRADLKKGAPSAKETVKPSAKETVKPSAKESLPRTEPKKPAPSGKESGEPNKADTKRQDDKGESSKTDGKKTGSPESNRAEVKSAEGDPAKNRPGDDGNPAGDASAAPAKQVPRPTEGKQRLLGNLHARLKQICEKDPKASLCSMYRRDEGQWDTAKLASLSSLTSGQIQMIDHAIPRLCAMLKDHPVPGCDPSK